MQITAAPLCRDRTVIILYHWSPLQQLTGSQRCQVELKEERNFFFFFSLTDGKSFDIYMEYSGLEILGLVTLGIFFFSILFIYCLAL